MGKEMQGQDLRTLITLLTDDQIRLYGLTEVGKFIRYHVSIAGLNKSRPCFVRDISNLGLFEVRLNRYRDSEMK